MGSSHMASNGRRSEALWRNVSLPHCAWSQRESFGFFCETDADWRLKRQRFVEALRQSEVDEHPASYIFWQNNWEPNFACGFEERPGAPGDGAKWLCDPHRIFPRNDVAPTARELQPPTARCVLYSFGSMGFFEWEDAMHARESSCEIHTFDHTMKYGSVRPPPHVQYHYWGIGSSDRWIHLDRQVGIFTLETIRRMLGHQGVAVEVLKIDVEGAEYATILPLVESGHFQDVRQLQIELHYELVPRARARNLWDKFVHLRRPKIVHPPSAHHRFFWALVNAGWAIFHKEPNTACALPEATRIPTAPSRRLSFTLIPHPGRPDALGGCVEYSLVRLSWDTAELLKESRAHWCVGGWFNSENTMRPVCKGWGPLAAEAPAFKHLGYEASGTWWGKQMLVRGARQQHWRLQRCHRSVQ